MTFTSLARVTAAASAALVAVPLSAATVTYTSGSTIALTPSAVPGTFDGAYTFRVVNSVPGGDNGLFTAIFTFESPFAGTASAVTQNVIVRGNFGSDVDFTGASINGTLGNVFNVDASSTAVVIDAPVGLGANVLTLMGRLNAYGPAATKGTGDALVTGSMTLTALAVPEPATWAFLVLGFGLIGGALRRRPRLALRYA